MAAVPILEATALAAPPVSGCDPHGCRGSEREDIVMTEMTLPQIVPFIIATFAGAVVASMSGFAFGLVASAIWLHVITPAQSAPLIAAFAIIINGWAVWKLRRSSDPRQILPQFAGRRHRHPARRGGPDGGCPPTACAPPSASSRSSLGHLGPGPAQAAPRQGRPAFRYAGRRRQRRAGRQHRPGRRAADDLDHLARLAEGAPARRAAARRLRDLRSDAGLVRRHRRHRHGH